MTILFIFIPVTVFLFEAVKVIELLGCWKSKWNVQYLGMMVTELSGVLHIENYNQVNYFNHVKYDDLKCFRSYIEK